MKHQPRIPLLIQFLICLAILCIFVWLGIVATENAQHGGHGYNSDDRSALGAIMSSPADRMAIRRAVEMVDLYSDDGQAVRFPDWREGAGKLK